MSQNINSKLGIGSLVNHAGESQDPSPRAQHPHLSNLHLSPFRMSISERQSSRGKPGYYYTRIKNPNLDLLANKYACSKVMT